MTFHGKLVGVQINVTAKAKETLDRQARERGIASSLWASQCFDIGFAAACAREKSMPVSDGDLDAVCEGTLLLKFGLDWKPAEIAQRLGVPEGLIKNILAGWKEYRRGQEAQQRKAK